MDQLGVAGIFGLLAVFGVLGLVVLALAVVFNDRGEVDSTGRRSTAIYLAVVSFVALYTLIIAGVFAIGSLSSLIIDTDDRGASAGFEAQAPFGTGTTPIGGGIPPAASPDGLGDDPGLDNLAEACFEGELGACDDLFFESPSGSDYEAYGDSCGGRNEPAELCTELYDADSFDGGFATGVPDPDDEAIRSAVQAGLIALVAAAVLAFHLRRRRDLVSEAGFEGTPGWRADRAFLYVVSAAAILIALFAAATVVYDVFRLIAPGITSDTAQSLERERAGAQIIPLFALTAATLYVFGRYWSETGQPPFWVRPPPAPSPDAAATGTTP